MSVSPTDVILSCEDMLSRVVNSTQSPEECCSSNCTKRSQLKSETSLKFSLRKTQMLVLLYPAEKRVQYEPSLSEETATEEVTAINTVFYGLQRYCTYTDKDAFIPNTHSDIQTPSQLFYTHLNSQPIFCLRSQRHQGPC